MSSSTWQDHFKDQLVGLEPPREGSYLELALEEGRIEEKAYFEWASHTHLVPVLQANYFTEATPDEGLLQKVSYPWRSTLFPVAQWDGVYFIAGLEKPSDLPGGCVFVYAPREGLSLWWEKLSEHAKPLEGPDGINLGGDLASENELNLSLDAAPAPTLSFAGVSLNVGAPAASTPQEASSEPAVALPQEKPAEVATSESPLVSTSENPSPALNPVPEASPEPFVLVSENSNSGLIDDGNTKTSITEIKSPVPCPVDGETKLHFNPTLEKHQLTDILLSYVGYKKDLADALHSVSGAYPQGMFLILDENREHLIPFAWTESIQQPDSITKIPLGSASVFEIVNTTEKPYHGFVVPNEINSKFFDAWNQGKLPETLSIVPVILNNQLVAMMLGMGPKSSYTLPILRHLERNSMDLIKRWKATLTQVA